jgi:hypothetical protein
MPLACFLFKIALALWGLYWFLMNFKIFSIGIKAFTGILMEIDLNL